METINERYNRMAPILRELKRQVHLALGRDIRKEWALGTPGVPGCIRADHEFGKDWTREEAEMELARLKEECEGSYEEDFEVIEVEEVLPIYTENMVVAMNAASFFMERRGIQSLNLSVTKSGSVATFTPGKSSVSKDAKPEVAICEAIVETAKELEG